jgi:hypothetical protein
MVILYPLYYAIVSNCLTRMVSTTQENGLIVGFVEHIIPRKCLSCNMLILCMKSKTKGMSHFKFSILGCE